MALTDIDKVKLEVGLQGLEFSETFISDDDITYFLEKNNNNIRRASMDVAKSLLFVLSRYVREQSGPELSLHSNQFFENYMKALKLFISDPNFSVAISMAQPYAGGISKSDIRANLSNPDTNPVPRTDNLPRDGVAVNSPEPNIFDRHYNNSDPFGF